MLFKALAAQHEAEEPVEKYAWPALEGGCRLWRQRGVNMYMAISCVLYTFLCVSDEDWTPHEYMCLSMS